MNMRVFSVASVLLILGFSTIEVAAQKSSQRDPKPASQPASQPSERRATLRKPSDANVLDELLEDDDQMRPIMPQQGAKAGGKPELGPDGLPLILEGTTIQRRPARIVRESGRSRIVFHLATDPQTPRTMELSPNQLREAMETESDAGVIEFIVSGEVKTYRGANFLELIMVQRKVGNGNLTP